ncbi:MAG: flagellar biosynthesis anti-sigma factor FlgM [bacterium]
MKIDGNDTTINNNTIIDLNKAHSGDRIRKSERERNAAQAQKGEQTNGSGDIVNISSQGSQVQRIKSMIENIPDIRQDRVDSIKQDLESGKYQVDSDNVARAMIRENLMYNLWQTGEK